MLAYITIRSNQVVMMENPMTCEKEFKIPINSMEELDRVIAQCRDIKLKLLEGSK